MNKIVALIGGNQKTDTLAPFDDLSVDIWTMTMHTMRVPRVTAVFEMHDDVFTSDRWEKYPDTEGYREWLRKNTSIPVYMHHPLDEIPAALRYPWEKIVKRLCGGMLWKGEQELKRMFGSTPSYLLAWALYLGYERVEMYGLELSQSAQIREERTWIFYWMGQANARGVSVYIPAESSFYQELFYPFTLAEKYE